MFELFSLWKEKNLHKKTHKKFIGMLKNCKDIFTKTSEHLWSSEESHDELKKEIYKIDIAINETERSIRKQIVEHLSIQPGQDIIYYLILMSITKDAERLGDYCKNLLDIVEYYVHSNEPDQYIDTFKGIQKEIVRLFDKATAAFDKSDEPLAKEILNEEKTLTRKFDTIILKLLKDEKLTSNQAICYTLTARYFKRITAHLGNITSSIVMPIHKLDYLDEKFLKDENTK